MQNRFQEMEDTEHTEEKMPFACLREGRMTFQERLSRLRGEETDKVKLKGLTLHQPWATLMAKGYKSMETRSWTYPNDRFPMLIAIHAGAQNSVEAERTARDMGLLETGEETPRRAVLALAWAYRPIPTEEPRVRKFLAEPWRAAERAFGDYTPGRFAWPMEVYPLPEPVPAVGRQKLWTPSEETTQQIRRLLCAGETGL